MSKLYSGTSAYKLEEYEQSARRHEDSRAARKNQRVKQNAAMCRLIIFAVIAVFGICSALIYTNVIILRAATDVEKLKDELAVVTEKNSRKEMEISQKLDMKVIEERAVNDLGMQRPDNSQIIYVDVKQNSYSEVAHTSDAGKTVLNSLKDVFGTVLEYFGK